MEANPSQWTSEGEAEPQSARTQQAVVNRTFRNHPVDSVLWTDANEFCDRLGQKEHRRYRLLTEAEWEYACRAGMTTRYPTGADSGGEKGTRLFESKTEGRISRLQPTPHLPTA